jgi:hypothetical protein
MEDADEVLWSGFNAPLFDSRAREARNRRWAVPRGYEASCS